MSSPGKWVQYGICLLHVVAGDDTVPSTRARSQSRPRIAALLMVVAPRTVQQGLP